MDAVTSSAGVWMPLPVTGGTALRADAGYAESNLVVLVPTPGYYNVAATVSFAHSGSSVPTFGMRRLIRVYNVGAGRDEDLRTDSSIPSVDQHQMAIAGVVRVVHAAAGIAVAVYQGGSSFGFTGNLKQLSIERIDGM